MPTMSTLILLPRLGTTLTDGRLAEWIVADGAPVRQGEPLYSLESEKTVQDIEAPASGTLRILKPAGETYEAGTVIGEIV